MFGSVGLCHAICFFGLIDDQALYFKVDDIDSNRPDYLACGCEPFRPFKDRPECSMSYFGVPAGRARGQRRVHALGLQVGGGGHDGAA